MTSKNQLGIFFGENSLSLVETIKNKIANYFDASHSLFEDKQTTTSTILPDEIKLTAIIQKSLRDKKIESTDVSLSLPSKDIILRSFFIPWMTSAEVKGVVDFEARRYIPFKLEELSYGYHAVTVKEKKSRRIRVLFLAIRKDILDKYCQILEQAGLKVIYSEPSAISLLRTFAFKKQLPQNQKVAIIQTDQREGTILIIDQGIPQFMRDFSLTMSSPTFAFDRNTLRQRLLNEIRISLDYFRRQQAGSDIEKLYFLSQYESNELAETLGKELNIAAQPLSTRTLLNLEEEVAIGPVYAFGIGLHTSYSFPVNINLAKAPVKVVEPEKAFEQVPINYLMSVKFAVGCALVLLLTFLFASGKANAFAKRAAVLSAKEGSYASLSTADIKKKEQELKEKLSLIKSLPLQSNLVIFLKKIPAYLPEGAWLKNFSVSIEDVFPNTKITSKKEKSEKEAPGITTKISLDLTGYVYLSDTSQQVNQVNTIISNLRNDPEFSKLFKEIALKSAAKDTVEDNNVTTFQITCR